MKSIENPILKGFNPDPSIVRVGEDYYIAVSTFEWYPGVYIYHSKDLVNWKFVCAPITEDYADLKGIDTSCGIWAPNLTYSNNRFYLVYTIVYTNRSRYKDTHNYLISSADINGVWTKPIYLNCSGFDPSLFHDNDKKWLVNMTIDHRINKERFSGITIQEYDEQKGKLVGEINKIFKGSNIGTTEGPNIIKVKDYYYLTVAEGGTEFGHCVTIARSKKITGPYDIDPNNPMLTSNSNPKYPLQRSGHGQLFNTIDGKWYMAHLCSRPLDGYSILGRETALQNIILNDEGWFTLEKEGNFPQTSYEVMSDSKLENEKKFFADFNERKLPWQFMTLRQSAENNHISLIERQGWLRIHGGNSLASKYNQGLIAIRRQSFLCEVKTKLEFEPKSYHHMAGLVCYYNYDNYYYLNISINEDKNIYINVISSENKVILETECIILKEYKDGIYLKVKMIKEHINFYYSFDDLEYQKVGDNFNSKILSDEHVSGNGFTGTMIGITCQDLRGDGIYADFDWFEYKNI